MCKNGPHTAHNQDWNFPKQISQQLRSQLYETHAFKGLWREMVFWPIRFFLGKRLMVEILFNWFEHFMSIGVFSIYGKILLAHTNNTFILCACLNTFVIFRDDFEKIKTTLKSP
jgi:hypothetical protein